MAATKFSKPIDTEIASLNSKLTWKSIGSKTIAANEEIDFGEDFTDVVIGSLFKLSFVADNSAVDGSVFQNQNVWYGRYIVATKSGTKMTVISFGYGPLSSPPPASSTTLNVAYR